MENNILNLTLKNKNKIACEELTPYCHLGEIGSHSLTLSFLEATVVSNTCKWHIEHIKHPKRSII
jgi:hypothetical protein